MEREEMKRTSRSQQCPLPKFHVLETVPATYPWASNPDCPFSNPEALDLSKQEFGITANLVSRLALKDLQA